jgi:hypothetical protein
MYDFILDRLKGYYADKGVPATHFNAVAELRPHSLYDFDRRIDAIGTFAQLPEAEALAAANKRIRNILRKAEGEVPGRWTTRCCPSRPSWRWPKRWRRPSTTPVPHWRSATTSACSAGWPSCARRWMRSSTRCWSMPRTRPFAAIAWPAQDPGRALRPRGGDRALVGLSPRKHR